MPERKYPTTRLQYACSTDVRMKEKLGRTSITVPKLASAMKQCGYNVSEHTIRKHWRYGVQTLGLALRYAEALYTVYGIDIPPIELIGYVSGTYSQYVRMLKAHDLKLDFQDKKITKRKHWTSSI